MKNLIKSTIIKQAVELGFDFDNLTDDYSLKEVNELLTDFFNEKHEILPQIEDECEVTSNRNSQHVSYLDFWADGEIVNFSEHWHKDPETKIFHSYFIMEDKDGLMKQMNLFYLVGQTEYNAPEGFIYSEKEKMHVKDEEYAKN